MSGPIPFIGAFESTYQPAFDTERGAALVALRVDDVHATGADGDVVDVRPGPGDAAVVQQADPLLRQAGQPHPEHLFAAGAASPGGRALRLVGEREDQSAEPGVRLPDASLSLRRPAFVLRRAEDPAVPVSTGSGRGPLAASATGVSGGTAPCGSRHVRHRTVFVDLT